MPKTASMYLLERTTQAKVLKLGLYVPWVGFYKSDIGIRKILIFTKVAGQNSSKNQYGCHFKTFLPVKFAKIKIFQIPMSLLTPGPPCGLKY